MKNIFAKLRHQLEHEKDSMLVTIISEQGSTPRGTGSQMLVGTDGHLTGTIGGGAVEKSAELRAVKLIAEKKSEVFEYRLHNDKEENLDMACGGDVTVLFHFVPGNSRVWKSVTAQLLDYIAKQKAAWLIQTVAGDKIALVDRDGAVLAGDEMVVSGEETSKVSILTDAIFSMPLPLGERAIIFGGGHCGLALAPLLKTVGFRVTVFDDREEFANRDRFPDAEEVICGDYNRICDFVTLGKEDYVVVMTTGHRHDFEVEEQALRGPLAYIGAMGSPAKTASVNKRLLERGIAEADLDRVYTPIGLNIKGTTPEEIAVSIAAEMILVRSEKLEKAGKLTRSCPSNL